MQKEIFFLSLASAISLFSLNSSPPKGGAPSAPMPYYYDANENYAFAYGDWLYWKPVTSDPLTFAYRGDLNLQTPDVATPVSQYRFLSTDYEFSSGYRIGGGYRSPERIVQDRSVTPWQFEVTFSQIASRADNFISGLPGELQDGDPVVAGYASPVFGVLPSQYINYGQAYLYGNYTSLQSIMDLKKYRLDAFFSWPVWVQKNLIGRLSVGSTFAWLKNEWQISGHNEGATHPLNDWHLNWDYIGGGLFGGGDIQVPFGYGFGFYAQLSGALTYGHVTEKEVYSDLSLNLVSTNFFISDHYQFASFQPVVNVGMGINFERWIYQTVLAQLGIGWEWNWWANMNRFSNPWNPEYQGEINDSSFRTPYYSVFQNKATDIIYQGIVFRAGLQY